MDAKDNTNSHRSPGTVLIIDDDPLTCRLLSKAFSKQGLKTLFCTNVTDAMHIIREELPDLIILDVHFPPGADHIHRDGFWTLDWINQVIEVKDTPVIMISGDTTVTTRHKALAGGADAFLPKPLHLQEVMDISLNLITLSQIETGS